MKAVLAFFATTAAAGVPTLTLNNGVEMPMMSIGTWQYTESEAEQVVKDAMATGSTHIATATNYNNQKGVGAARKDSPGSASASVTEKTLGQDLVELGLGCVGLTLVHYPPSGNSCSSMQAQWTAVEDFYKAGKPKAVGVSNFCPSFSECIMQTATVTSAVNQVQYHVGMGADPIGVKSAPESYGTHLQAYSPLGNGESDLTNTMMICSRLPRRSCRRRTIMVLIQ